LTINFIKNIISNSRFFDEVKLFEIGNIFFQLKKFKNPSEVPTIGLIWASKKDETFFRLKGVASALFKKIGVVDFLLAPAGRDNWIKEAAGGYLDIDNSLKIEVGGSSIIGYLGKLKIHSDLKDWRISVFEADIGKLLEYVEAEHEYLPLPKYPSIIRDISMWVAQTTRVGDIMQAIQENGLTYIEDVDLMDEYIPKKSKVIGYTFRIVFQAEDRTLTDKEVNKIMEKIVAELKRKFKVEIR
jgi:phenylalanyl-tRNA synthetase beta chain